MIGRLKKQKTERISTRILYALVGVAVVVFALFYIVGYNLPYIYDPSYNAPLFTDVVLWLLYAMTLVAICVAACAVWHGYRTRSAEAIVNGIPAARIAWITVALLVVSLVVGFVIGSSVPVRVNGKAFDNTFWLKTTDMFIFAITALVVVAVVAVVFSMSGLNRKTRLHNR